VTAANGTPALEVQEVRAGYTQADVLHGVSMRVGAGEAVALVGANGAGKSTLLRTISGLMCPREGSVRFRGEEIGGRPAHAIARAGLAHVPEGREILVRQTVEENLLLGAIRAGDREERLEQLLDVFPVLREKLHQGAGELSGGQQQMLAIARGLMSSPSVLMLDEPSLGLSPKLVDEVTALLERVRSDLGTTVLLVEQNAAVAAGAADRAYVMRRGRIVMEEKAADLLGSEDVVSAYLA
jgi:branched-chain amino acid transport system ATP-binding protein